MSPIVRRIFQLLALTAVQALILFISAWSLTWRAGWIYVGLYVVLLAIASIIMLPQRAEVIAERSKGSEGGKPWDILITRLMGIPTLGLLAVAGCDERWQWSPQLPSFVPVIGIALFIGGYIMVVWAMYTNQFFSSVVRIQTERGHAAVTTGPYHYVRHPGYIGMLTSALGGVLLLESLWALIPYGFYLALVIVRTALEDRTLRAELPGYADYATRTRYRLFPFIW